MRLAHHDLCFGCGLANPFGLGLELERDSEPAGLARGRFFVKQDHQGPGRDSAHEGVLAAALMEAMGFVLDADGAARPGARTVQLSIEGSAPVGAYVTVEAEAARRDGEVVEARAVARSDDGAVVARGAIEARPGDSDAGASPAPYRG